MFRITPKSQYIKICDVLYTKSLNGSDVPNYNNIRWIYVNPLIKPSIIISNGMIELNSDKVDLLVSENSQLTLTTQFYLTNGSKPSHKIKGEPLKLKGQWQVSLEKMM